MEPAASFPRFSGVSLATSFHGNDQHVVADGADFGQNMGAEDNGVFLFQAFDQIADFVDLFWVKADSRLIQNNNLRVTKHSLRNTNLCL